jgi:signal transduction histidine kinase
MKERERTQQKELEQAREIEKAYQELKDTQQQLIHSEKMASLGELTAGIAHEIQNPLNFVNNFSDVNSELIDELKEALQNGNLKEVEDIAGDIGENEKKIVHHGKRAEEIVKSMLQHSRGTEGKRELTDLNALADEYLRLAFHGMRARDKSFNSEMEMDFDKGIGEIMVVPQDIGRVLLNLITNAFHALKQRKEQQPNGYQPRVEVITRMEDDKVKIVVKDNGTGIPQSIRKKVFEPFFSTKGTGKGTGLGLSLSYDIITQGHSGTIEVLSEEGSGTEFIIRLPNKT